jgi:hypothetical protein
LPYPNFCQQKTLRPLISPSLIHHPPTSRSQRLHHGFPHGFRARGLPVSAIWRCMQLQLFRCTGADLIRPHSLDRPFCYLLASNEPDTDSDKYVYSPALIMPFTLLTVAALKPPVISVLRSTVPVPSLWSPRPQRSQRRGQQGNQNQGIMVSELWCCLAQGKGCSPTRDQDRVAVYALSCKRSLVSKPLS